MNGYKSNIHEIFMVLKISQFLKTICIDSSQILCQAEICPLRITSPSINDVRCQSLIARRMRVYFISEVIIMTLQKSTKAFSFLFFSSHLLSIKIALLIIKLYKIHIDFS